MLPLVDIKNAQNILIQTDNASFANASAIYSYILTLHKKVSLSKIENIENNLKFLPWFDKLRDSVASSSDLTIVVSKESLKYFNFFKSNGIKINLKMATALYSGILQRYNNFNSSECNGTVFAACSELISLKANYTVARQAIVNSQSLAIYRLRSILFKNLLLIENAKVAQSHFSDEDLKASGASMQEVYTVMRELLSLVNVSKVVLLKSDENFKIIKTIEEM